MYSLPFRQIHLDFHTSEQILPVAQDFDADEFAEGLSKAHVNSVTCFSKCHHGMIYHPTRFEAKHPGLTRNLLGEQIEACHKRGIKVPIYISAGLDEFMLRQHPDWIVLGADGRQSGPSPVDAGYHLLCFGNKDYVDYLVAEIDEVFELFPVDGLFFDIIGSWGCCCAKCRKGMADEGYDLLNAGDRSAYSDLVTLRFKERLTDAVRAHSEDCGIFFNSGHVGPHWREEGRFYSHLELESLPSGGWGYDHFPVTARYARNLGVEFLGMTGKFQTHWGDFGSFKNVPALEYECFTALALGGRCSVGDQLHPNGKLTDATYDLVGEVYGQVEAKEPWCTGVRPMVDIAIVNPEAIGRSKGRVDDALAGAHRILKEGHHQYDVIDTKSDLATYKVVILPDIITLDEEFSAKLEGFVAMGGKLLASYESLLSPGLQGWALPVMKAAGVGHDGPYGYEKTYVTPSEAIAQGVPKSEHVMYERGMKLAPVKGSVQVIADQWDPYFDRNAKHFSSHAHTPVAGRSENPAAIRAGGVVYFAHPIFRLYKKFGVRAYKQMVLNALSLLLPEDERILSAKAPSVVEFMVNRQEDMGRTVVHALNYIPVRRADNFDIIEEVIPCANIGFNVRLDGVSNKKPGAVKLEPQGVELPFEWDGKYAAITIPVLQGHQLVVIED